MARTSWNDADSLRGIHKQEGHLFGETISANVAVGWIVPSTLLALGQNNEFRLGLSAARIRSQSSSVP